MQKYSDDGEPAGTAGMPILNVLEKKEISNAVITVTRYFGGILLGKGGLTKAYSQASVQAAMNAGLTRTEKGSVFSLDMPYDMADKLLYDIAQTGWNTGQKTYGSSVVCEVTCTEEDDDKLKAFITDKSRGRVQALRTGDTEIRVKLTDF